MKKIVLEILGVIGIIVMSISNVYALSTVKEDVFEYRMSTHGYTITDAESGISAEKNKDSTIYFHYRPYENEEEAKKELQNLCVKNDEAIQYKSFNILSQETTENNESISCEYTEEESTTHFYEYAIRIGSQIIHSTGTISDQEEINSIIAELTMDDVNNIEVDETQINYEKLEEKPTTTKQTSQENNFIPYIIAICGIIIFISIIIVIFKRKK